MKGLSVVFLNNIPYGSRVYADGKEITPKRDVTGVYVANAETEKDEIEIKIVNPYLAEMPFWKWFFTTLLCWAVSFFGLFDTIDNKRCVSVKVGINATTGETAFVKLRFLFFKDGAPAVEIAETNTGTAVTENAFSLDKTAKKRNRIYKIFRILSLVAVAVIVAVLIIK